VPMKWLAIIPLIIVVGYAPVRANSEFLTTKIPFEVQSQTSNIEIQWTGSLRSDAQLGMLPPDSGYIYYDRFPGGKNLSAYRYKVKPKVDSLDDGTPVPLSNVYIAGTPPKRSTTFVPQQQTDMGSGLFYCIIALPLENDTLYSNEFQVLVESPTPVSLIGPGIDPSERVISELTPTFQWEANTGVPYYHVILSDEPIVIDTAGGDDGSSSISITGLSIIWQAITPNTQIVYGAPDPSGTITASPPPLSPGTEYTWLVLNNYGNQVQYSSAKVKLPVGNFSLEGEGLEKPVNVTPIDDTLTIFDNPKVTFSWTNLDPDANTYKVYVYVSSTVQGIDAQLVVWENEVTAGDFTDTASVVVDAANILTTNRYTWKVIAVDDKGAGTIGDTTGFRYEAPTGNLHVYTREKIVSGDDTITATVGLSEIEVEVLDGSLEAPLLFFSDGSGSLQRERPVGTYRITAKKDGFESATKTVEVLENQTTTTTLFLTRPEATLYGKIVDPAAIGINLATITGYNDLGDTVTAKSDANGSFLFNASGADWTLRASKKGYITSSAKTITVQGGESVNFGNIELVPNPISLSGIVKNGDGNPVLGVKLELLDDEGNVLDVLPSTPQSGQYSFTVSSGNFLLRATKTGFTTYQKTLAISSSAQLDITMQAGAALVTGTIQGIKWIGVTKKVAPITGATVKFIPTDSQTDTFSTVSDATYGDFRLSLPPNRSFIIQASANGYIPRTFDDTLATLAGKTQTVTDTLNGFATVFGSVLSSGDKSGVTGASVQLIKAGGETVAYSAKSSADGSVEFRTVSDGNYILRAGRDGLVVDSISPIDTVTVTDGKVAQILYSVYMTPGTKQLVWESEREDVTIKIKSPLQKNLSVGDTLQNAGSGTYTIEVDAVNDSIIDLANYQFTVADTETIHLESFTLPVTHTPRDSVHLQDGALQLQISSQTPVDSAVFYYKMQGAASFNSTTVTSSSTTVSTDIVAPKDGAHMQYYIVAFIGAKMYGYSKELYSLYIHPDTTRVSKIEIAPSSTDTLRFAHNSEVDFSIGLFVSSAYVVKKQFDSSAVSWVIKGNEVSTLSSTTGAITTLSAQSDAEAVGMLIAQLDTDKLPVTENAPSADTIFFKVSSAELDSLAIRRIDPQAPNPITTARGSRALFSAEAFDKNKNRVTVSPEWGIEPQEAGEISARGEFTPNKNFFGRVRITCKSAEVSTEYVAPSQKRPGLQVQYVISRNSTPDTVHNFEGMSLVVPANIVSATDFQYLGLSRADLTNMVYKGSGSMQVVGKAFDIFEREKVQYDIAQDSFTIMFEVSEGLQKKVMEKPQNYYVARWDDDSLKWDTLSNTIRSTDGSTLSAALGGFSRYGVVSIDGSLGAEFSVSPNPFSPYVRPVQDHGFSAQVGCAMQFTLDAKEITLEYAWIRIFSMLGDQVYSVKLLSPVKNSTYTLWWDGKSTKGDQSVPIKDISKVNEHIAHGPLLRNGRYFVVLSVKDLQGEVVHIKKPVIILK